MQLTLRMVSAAGFADADLGLPEVPTVTEIYIPSAFVLWIRICRVESSYSGTWRHLASPMICCVVDMQVFA